MEKFILFAPLIGSLIAGFGWRAIGEKAAQYLIFASLLARRIYEAKDAPKT